MKTGILYKDMLIPLSFLTKKGDSLKTLKNLLCADIDSKGNFYVVDGVVTGLHVFSYDFIYKKTIKTALDGKIKSISIDPVDNINLIESTKSVLLILDEFGEEIEAIDLKEKFGIIKPTKIVMDWIGNKFIFDSRNKTIFILNQENELISRFLLVKKGNVLVKNPKDFCIDELSNLYVLDGSNNTIVKFE